MTVETAPAKPNRRRLLAVVGAVVLLAGIGGIYGIGQQSGNVELGGTCAAGPQVGENVKSLLTGDVAAMVPAREPMDLRDLAFQTEDGAPKTIADFAGKVLLVNLWATWCAPCREEMPALDALQANHGSDDFSVVAINLDTRDPKAPRKFLESIGVTRLDLYLDPSLSAFETLKRKGRAFGLPVTLLLDRQGCEIAAMNGPAQWHSKDAERLIEKAVQLTAAN